MNTDNFIYGINPVNQLLKNSPDKVIELYFSENKNNIKIQNILNLAKKNSISIQKVDKRKLEKWFPEQNTQGIAIKTLKSIELDEKDLKQIIENNSECLFLILDSVQDPHNLGACIRTAECAGVDAVIIPKDKSASITPLVRKIASGACESVPIVTVNNLARALKFIQEQGVWLVGTCGNEGQDIYSANLKGRIGIIMGSEGAGLRELTRKHCDFFIKIPMLGVINSLNVSVATGISLFEAVRQKKLS